MIPVKHLEMNPISTLDKLKGKIQKKKKKKDRKKKLCLWIIFPSECCSGYIEIAVPKQSHHF